MLNEIDILLVTYMKIPRDAGDPAVYKPLRLEIEGHIATIPLLRMLARDAVGESSPSSGRTGVVFVPTVLTPIYLQDYATRRGIRLVDIPCLELGIEQVSEAIAGGVGLIALSTTWLPHPGGATVLREAAAKLRSLAPGVPIIAGGVGVRKGLLARRFMLEGRLPGISREELAMEYLLIEPHLDNDINAVVISEGGEATMAAIAQRIRRGENFKDLPNLALPEGDDYRFTDMQPESTDLDAEIVDWTRHKHRLGIFDAPIRTTVGCPFQCEFCDFTGLYKPRQRSLESLITELRTLAGALPPPRRVYFTDDNLAISRKRLLAFSRAMIDANLGITWRGFMRVDTIDSETVELMRDSGCRECTLGIESGDPQILKNIKKRLDPDRALRAIELLDANDINTTSTFVVGFPGECDASIERTAAFISALPSGEAAKGIHRYYLFRFQVLPLSRAATPEKRDQYQLTGLYEHWSHLTMNAEEAKEAVRELFLKVQGPSHNYIELLPPEWPVSTTRRVLELRDAIQKERLRDSTTVSYQPLLHEIQSAESIVI